MGRIVRYGSIGLFLVVAISCSFFLPRRDVRTIGQVAGYALDEKNGMIYATFELYSPSVDQPIGKERQVLTSMGKTIKACVKEMERKCGKKIYIDDAEVLILGGDRGSLMEQVLDYYKKFSNDHMDLPIFFAQKQEAGMIFKGKGEILSTQISQSAKNLKKRQTVRDLMNGTGEKMFIKGEGSYEIIS